jgi:Trp operon repressor
MPGKVRPSTLSPSDRNNLERHVLSALKCSLQHDPYLFLSLLTKSEQIMVARRVQIALRLLKGDSPENIRSSLHVGQATVEHVQWLLLKEFEGSNNQLVSISEEVQKRLRQAEPIDPQSFRGLRHKYPLHFLFFNLLLDDIRWEKHHQKPPSYSTRKSQH